MTARSRGGRAYHDRPCGIGGVDHKFDRGSVHRQHAISTMTSRPSRRRRTAICWVSISATAASHGTAECGVFESFSTKKYPAIIDRCRGAIDVLMPGQRAAVLQRARRCVEVSLYSNTGPASYPSTAPARSTQDASRWSRGSRRWSTTPRKSSSPVSSTATAVASSPTTVGSGACLITSRTDPKTSSGFTAALDALDIPLTRPDWRTIAIYRKAATARLDEFVGPKDRAVPLNCVHYTA
jgi:hypothetical protein